MQKFPPPTSKSEVRTFLEFVGFYRCFIPAFLQLAAPLYNLMRKNQAFNWGSAQNKSFLELIKRMTTAPVLIQPDFNKQFILYMDASKFGLRAILQQEYTDGQHII